MFDSADVIVARSASPREIRDWQLVLAAAGIHAGSAPLDGEFVLFVAERDRDRATRELTDYLAEARDPPPRPPAPPPIIGRGLPGAVLFVLVLQVAWLLQGHFAGGLDWTSLGRVDGRAMLAGEWWRSITALTLHADFGHLLANLCFGAVFGGLAARYLGTGSAWLAIVVAGGLGNALNVMLQGPDHRSIGASTAVFGALGLLGAFIATHRRRGTGRWAERWGALIAAGAILAYTGAGGERTDVGAHLTGFATGAGLGWLLAGTRYRPRRLRVDAWLGAGALGLVMLAWAMALAAG